MFRAQTIFASIACSQAPSGDCVLDAFGDAMISKTPPKAVKRKYALEFSWLLTFIFAFISDVEILLQQRSYKQQLSSSNKLSFLIVGRAAEKSSTRSSSHGRIIVV